MRREERVEDPELSLREALEGFQADMWTALPGTITSVDLVKQTVEVQPTIQAIRFDKEGNPENVTITVLINVPIVWPRAGGFALTFPIKIGDEVLVVFSSRSIDSWWQNGGVGAQVERRMHDLSDGFAILAPTSVPKALPNVSSGNVQLRNESGNTFIEIDDAGKISLISSVEIKMQAPIININGQATTITADATNINSQNATINGVNFTVNSSSVAAITAPVIQLNGSTAITGGITIDGESYTSHAHSGVEPGIGITGGVV